MPTKADAQPGAVELGLDGLSFSKSALKDAKLMVDHEGALNATRNTGNLPM